MSGAAFLRIKKLKGGGIITAAARHNRREIQAEMGAVGSIDPTRSRLNESLCGPSAAADVGQLAKDLMTAAGVGKLRKDAVQGLEVVFSLPPGHAVDDRAYFTACADWAASAFGGHQNVLSVDIHRDEAQPHCHILLLPLVEGRMAGSDLIGGKQKLAALQKDFHAKVAGPYGFTKAPAKLLGTTKQVGVKAVLQKLRETSDCVLQSAAWPAIREAIESNPAPYLLALGIELPTVKKPARTMEQIFTSKGKGPARETANPIGFTPQEKEQTLCSVGFAEKTPLPAARLPLDSPPPDTHSHAPKSDALESVRVRDRELDPAHFDPDSGEFFTPPPPPARHQKQAADEWVRQALTKQTPRPLSNFTH